MVRFGAFKWDDENAPPELRDLCVLSKSNDTGNNDSNIYIYIEREREIDIWM